MGPHVKRARIALLLVGILFAVSAYLKYGDISDLRKMVRGEGGEMESLVNMAYYFIVATIIAGVANIFFAAIGGSNPTLAIYGATGVFGLYTMFALYVGGIILFTSWVWWLTTIVLVIAFQAVYKAEQLRKQRAQEFLRA
jgi:hypothetical protein